jgi:two-component system, NtrC family, response regulator HydG
MLTLVFQRSLGAQVTAFEDGAPAWEALRQGMEPPPDLLLSDLRMPGLDGLELCRRVRAHYADLPIIVFSAYVNEDFSEEAETLHIAASIRKPALPVEILRVVRETLGLAAS